jgi:hypothetical protein
MRSSIHNDNSLDYQYYEPIDIDTYFDLDKWYDIDSYLNNIEVSPALDQGDDGDNEMVNYTRKTKIDSACQQIQSPDLSASS